MLFKLRIGAGDLATGRAAAGIIGELVAPEPLAVTLFEDKPPAFVVEAYWDAEPALAAIVDALAGLAAKLGAPSLEAVPDENWVALSQAALPPVAAGRFIVHGSHDRRHFAARRHAVEIDAGEAFGTGHNATTALCLEAIDLLARRRRFRRVIDLGCGSGVLAIAAARTFPGRACSPSTTTRSPPPWRAPMRGSTASPAAYASSTPRASAMRWCAARSPSTWCSPTSSPAR